MNRRAFSYTMIKRAHLVLQCGVGSVLRTRQGLTAVVAGLPEWQYCLGVTEGNEAKASQYIKEHSFREAELTAATGLERFVAPPAYSDSKKNWEIPVIRFPLAASCSNWKCRRLTYADHGTAFSRSWSCPHCGKNGKGRLQQVPIFLACAQGHLDELDWSDLIDHDEGCHGIDIQLNFRTAGAGANAKCLSCGKKATSRKIPCTGARPWLPGCSPERCDLEMEVVSRTSVKVYYPSTKSAIHIPVDAELNGALVEWMRVTNWAAGRAVANEAERAVVGSALREVGWDVDDEAAAAHVSHVLQPADSSDEEWAILSAREREFDILSGRRTYPALSASSLISLEMTDLKRYQHPLVGPNQAIIGITAVHKLTESRTVNGFSRIQPRIVPQREGRLMMWGTGEPSESWLPGYRSHGEGIFIQLNATYFDSVGCETDSTGRELFVPSQAGVTAHTLAHLLINQLAETSGYSAPSIRDRVYDLANGSVGVLVYTADGDSMGTLGGLVAFAQPGEFEPLLDRAVRGATWCAQDPVCEESTLDHRRNIHAACHQCVLLPETSCELFNGHLDRRTVQMLVSRSSTGG